MIDLSAQGGRRIAAAEIVSIPETISRVSAIVRRARRRKVAEERTRGVQGSAYGDLMFWSCRGGRW